MSETTNTESKTSAQAWKKRRVGQEVTLPSGNVCRAKKVGMDAFIREGMIPNTLMPMIKKQMAQGQGKPPSAAKQVVNMADLTTEQINDMFRLADSVCLNIVTEPTVKPTPIRTVKDDEGNDIWETVYNEDGDPVPNDEGTGPKKKLRREVVPMEDRDDGDFVYLDDVDFEDKMFLFNWSVGGSADATKFREQLATDVADLQSGQDLELPSESTT